MEMKNKSIGGIFMNCALIVAGGTGSRMKMDTNKQFLKLNDKEVVIRTMEAFDTNLNIDEIIVVLKKEEIEFFKTKILPNYRFIKPIKLVEGGKQRQDSVYNGLKALDKDCKNVLVHDGARPFVTQEIINDTVSKLKELGAVVVAVKVKDTIKYVDEEHNIESTLNRDSLFAVQTPQAFRYKMLLKAYEHAYENEITGTDDSSLVEKLGYKVKIIDGSYDNIKITTKEDLDFAYQILKRKGE
jgi:2-C-methyl-D-erythritol 4-phosphate cytidylyltransferase